MSAKVSGVMDGGLGGTNYYNARCLRAEIPGGSFGSGRNKHDRALSKYLNQLDKSIEVGNASRTFSSRFTWEGKTISHYMPGYIENILFFNGFAIAYNDEEYGETICPASITNWSRTWQPNEFQTILKSGPQRTLSLEECAIILDNRLWIPQCIQAQRKSEIIADCGRTIENQINALKKPTLIATTDKDALTNKTMAEQMLNNSPFILYTPKKRKNNMQDPFLSVNKTNASSADLMGLIAAKHALRKDLYCSMGIGGDTSAKSQYLNKDEVDNQEDPANILAQEGLACREWSVEKIKEKLGWDIRVIDNMEKDISEEEIEEGEKDVIR